MLRVIQRVTVIRTENRRFEILLIVQAWIIGVIVASTYAYFLQFENHQCVHKLDSNVFLFVWGISVTVIWSVLPLFILSIGFCVSQRKLKSLSRSSLSITSRHYNKREQRVTRTFSIIIGVFFLLSTPYACFTFYWTYLNVYNKEEFNNTADTNRIRNIALLCICSLNFVVNPFIYARFEIFKHLRRMSQRIATRAVIKIEQSDLCVYSLKKIVTY